MSFMYCLVKHRRYFKTCLPVHVCTQTWGSFYESTPERCLCLSLFRIGFGGLYIQSRQNRNKNRWTEQRVGWESKLRMWGRVRVFKVALASEVKAKPWEGSRCYSHNSFNCSWDLFQSHSPRKNFLAGRSCFWRVWYNKSCLQHSSSKCKITVYVAFLFNAC